MKIFGNIYVIFAAILIQLLCACTKGEVDVPQNKGTGFVLETKAPAPAGSTFRIMAYGMQEDNLFNYVSSGSYCHIEGKEFGGVKYLTASELDDAGTFIREDGTKALAVPYEQLYRENFFIAYISPGMLHNEDGSFTADAAKPFYCSDVQPAQLKNYGIVEMRKELIDRRAKIGFRIYKDDVAFELSEFRIEGAGNVYWPATAQVTPKDAQLSLGEALKPVANDDTLAFECVGEDMPFILSGLYAPADTVSSRIQKDTENYPLEFAPANLQESGYLNAKFTLSISGNTFEMIVPLSKEIVEIQPLTTYMYHITIKNAYIHTILEISPIEGVSSWEDVTVDFEIEDNTISIDLGNVEIQGWEDSNWEEIEIDDPENN